MFDHDGSSALTFDPAGELPTRELERELTTYSAHLAAGTSRFLELLAEFDRREAYKQWDCASSVEWLSWRCGIAKRSAREQVRVALRLSDLPLVRERFKTGELSYSKVRALTRVATETSEEIASRPL